MSRIKNVIPFSLLLAAIVCLVFAAEMTAYFFHGEAAANEFSVGIQTSHIEEEFEVYDMFKAGTAYTKKVAVVNDGTVSCYVRVFAETESYDTRNIADIDYNNEEWVKDGIYYYYRKALKAGESTVPLFTAVTAKQDIADFKMICSSESVQADGYKGYRDAFAALDGGGAR